MSRIFISTDYYSLETIFDRNQLPRLIDIDTTPFYLSLDDGNIIIIKDSIENFPEGFQIDKLHDYLLHHSSIKADVKNSFDPKNCIPGRHDNRDEFLYKPTFDIIVSNSENKIDAIIKLLFDPKKQRQLNASKPTFFIQFTMEKMIL